MVTICSVNVLIVNHKADWTSYPKIKHPSYWIIEIFCTKKYKLFEKVSNTKFGCKHLKLLLKIQRFRLCLTFSSILVLKRFTISICETHAPKPCINLIIKHSKVGIMFVLSAYFQYSCCCCCSHPSRLFDKSCIGVQAQGKRQRRSNIVKVWFEKMADVCMYNIEN